MGPSDGCDEANPTALCNQLCIDTARLHLQLLLLLLQMAERGLGVRVLSRRHLDRGDGRRH